MMEENIRHEFKARAKEFKSSWIRAAEFLYLIWRDKKFEYWGYERLEHFTEKECGLKKSVVNKMIKCYSFIENNEPQFQRGGLYEKTPTDKFPEIDAINVLRSARLSAHVTKDEYKTLRDDVFLHGKQADIVRRDLKAIIEKKKSKTDANKAEERRIKAARKLVSSWREFVKEMSTPSKAAFSGTIENITKLIRDIETDMC